MTGLTRFDDCSGIKSEISGDVCDCEHEHKKRELILGLRETDFKGVRSA